MPAQAIAGLTIMPESDQTIAGVSLAIREGGQTCCDVLEACLARIDSLERKVRAWVVVDRDGARAQAKLLDSQLAAGRWLGPLHGIPIGIKDIVDVAGLPTAGGSKLWANRTALSDAPIVARLRAAGAVIVGKTVTTQYAWIDPPVTANPWNLERTPGGSSSGSAAALACGMCLGAIGSQTGGSITRPASFCGVAGCKPTHGRLSVQGILPMAPSLDHPGPLARTVADLALMWDALASAGSDSTVSRPRTAPPRLGRLRGFFDERADASMRQALDFALAVLTGEGAGLDEPALPESFADVLAQHRAMMASEVAAWHEARIAEHPDDYLPRISELITEGLGTLAVAYVRAREHQERLKRDILDCFDQVDALVVPATVGAAPDRSTTGNPAFNSPWSYTGLPTISFPIALDSEGLPLAIQLVGRPLDERSLFETALWCENVLH